MLTDQITLHLQNNLERLPICYWNKHIVVCGAGYKLLSFKYVNSCCENRRRGTVSAIVSPCEVKQDIVGTNANRTDSMLGNHTAANGATKYPSP
jgi:hypothetical protein